MSVNCGLYKQIDRFLVACTDQLQDLLGHRLRIVAVSYFPHIDYVRHEDRPGTMVTLKDSVDARLIQTFAKALNFT